ncbi:V-type proton ATPase subunit E [Dissostichus eleginoides]|uniref:V-type proton ATPase subunit E n=1 Tax=Dissostichus eleginoides TaxID=100907 RepID=A0AAD9EX50_DISEL|nr:V-type proton ATPase subunit E [Dissostichus eleginoides]
MQTVMSSGSSGREAEADCDEFRVFRTERQMQTVRFRVFWTERQMQTVMSLGLQDREADADRDELRSSGQRGKCRP